MSEVSNVLDDFLSGFQVQTQWHSLHQMHLSYGTETTISHGMLHLHCLLNPSGHALPLISQE